MLRLYFKLHAQLIMLDDAIKMVNANIELIDISELVLSAI